MLWQNWKSDIGKKARWNRIFPLLAVEHHVSRPLALVTAENDCAMAAKVAEKHGHTQQSLALWNSTPSVQWTLGIADCNPKLQLLWPQEDWTRHLSTRGWHRAVQARWRPARRCVSSAVDWLTAHAVHSTMTSCRSTLLSVSWWQHSHSSHCMTRHTMHWFHQQRLLYDPKHDTSNRKYHLGTTVHGGRWKPQLSNWAEMISNS